MVSISRPSPTDVTKTNPVEFLYIKGDADTDGSIRLIPDTIDASGGEVQARVSGVWVTTSLLSTASNDVKVVKTLEDMPDPVLKDGVLTIDPGNCEYLQNNNIDSPYPLSYPGAGNRWTWKTVNRSTWNYTGTDACFRDLSAEGDIEIQGLAEFTATNGYMFEWDSQGSAASFQATTGSRFTDMNGIGTMTGPGLGVGFFFGTLSNFDTGLVGTDMDFTEFNSFFVFGNDTTTTDYFKFDGAGTLGPINMLLISTAPGSNETLFNFDPEIRKTVNSILIQNTEQFGDLQGQIFAPGSLTQASPIVTAQANAAFSDSTIKGKLDIVGNTLVTTINTVNVPVPINAEWSDGSIEERIVFQDFCTFDNTTNVITAFNDVLAAAFSHGLSNGDVVTLAENGGLPAELLEDTEYFIINVAATTFQVSLTSGGSAVTFTDNGTPPNYYRHVTGVSRSGWAIYAGLQDASVVVQGWVAIDKTGTSRNAGTQIIKTDVNFVESNAARGSSITVQNNKGQSSTVSDIVNLSTGEGIRVFIENRENSDNLIATDADLTFNRA